jgi:hypothetical protein
MLRSSISIMAILAAVLLTASAALAGGVIVDGHAGTPPPPIDNTGKAGASSSTSSPTDQQIYLWAAMVLNGHDAANAPGAPNVGPCNIIDDIEPDDAVGGCAQTPSSALAVLAGLLLLFRRRRA